MEITRKLKSAIIVFLLVFMAVTTSLSIIFFHRHVSQIFQATVLKSITEVQDLHKETLKESFAAQFAMLEHASSFLEEKPGDSLCAMFMLDLDNFKQVNDTLGHLAGDKAIKDAAKKLSLIFSEKDFISRFGGDEFCILLRVSENMDKQTFMKIVSEKAKNLCLLLKEKYFDEKNVVAFSASVGIALCPECGTSYDQLFHCADEALYQVKHDGKNGFKIFQ